MRPLRAVILDFDGVIVESNHLKTRAFETVFSRFPEHAEAMMAYHRAHVSDSRFAKFRYLATARLGMAPDAPEAERLVAQLAEAFSVETQRQVVSCPLVPGADRFLDHAAARVPLYLASVTPEADLQAILQQRNLTGYFQRVYGCPPWTKASAVEAILALVGGRDGVVFIGDSAGDQRAAQATGVEFLARDSGLPFDSPQPIQGRDMADMLAMIESRLPLPTRSM